MRISDWSSDVCSSDLLAQKDDGDEIDGENLGAEFLELRGPLLRDDRTNEKGEQADERQGIEARLFHMMNERNGAEAARIAQDRAHGAHDLAQKRNADDALLPDATHSAADAPDDRTEEKTTEHQSIMRTSYTGSCLTNTN